MRLLPVFLAMIAVASPAFAATYVGTPASVPADAKVVARDIVWTLSGGSYRGKTDESRPLVLCQSLAKAAGRLEAFTVNGAAIGEAELAKCNRAAPAESAAALAQAR